MHLHISLSIVIEVCFRVKIEILSAKEGDMESPEKIYTIQEAADKLSVGYRTVLDWIATGNIGYYKLNETNNFIRIGEHHIVDFLKSHDTAKEK